MTPSVHSAAFTRSEQPESALRLPLWPTLWGMLLLAALAFRLIGLGSPPLAPDEAARALEARAIWRAAPVEYADGPALTNVMTLWFALFTDGDGTARVPSALFGAALCLTPLLFRAQLGSRAALAATALLTISPLAILISRVADSASLAALAIAVAVGSGLLAWERSEKRWLLMSCAAVAVGLGAGESFVGHLVAVVFAVAASPPLRLVAPNQLRQWTAHGAGVGLAAALLVDTLFLTRPSGLHAGLVAPFADWAASVGVSLAAPASVLMLLVHEVVLLSLAVFAAARSFRKPFPRFLLVWAVATLGLSMLRRSPDLGTATGLLVPLALLAGLAATHLSRRLARARAAIWALALAGLAPLVFLVLAINALVNRGSSVSVTPVVLALGGCVAVLLLASTWLRPRELVSACLLAAVLGISVLSLSSVTRLNFASSERAAPVLFAASSRSDLRQVEARVRDWWRQDPEQSILVDASLRPLLAWSLRDGPPVDWIMTAPVTADRAILGGLTAQDRPAGAWVRLVVAERYTRLEELEPDSLWRWLVRRESLVGVEPHAILITQ